MQVFGDVKSETGRIVFKPDGVTSSAILNSTGLGVGTTPSSNLHISGNASLSDRLVVGSSVLGSSNLNIHGTYGMGLQTVSTNTNLNSSSMVLADSSTQDIVLTLPYADNVQGRIYKIKKISSSNNVSLIASNCNIEYLYESILLGDDSGVTFPSVDLISSDSTWLILNYSSVSEIQTDISGNLIRHYKFDETSGTTANDSSENADHGTLNGSFSFAGESGVINNALDFPGTGNSITTSFGSGWNPSTNPISISVWAKPMTSANGSGVLGPPLGSSQRTYIGLTSSSWSIGIQGSPYSSNTEFDVSYNTWAHLVLVMDGSTATLYVDGVKGTTAQSVKAYTSYTFSNNFTLGNVWGPHFIGELDDIRIYSRVLTNSEILGLYESKW